ncbi:MAG: TonB-dependent receptor [Kiritimatiellales bacterium]|nr:TonB-dependent receptor [Kiritimatiellales bacterium]
MKKLCTILSAALCFTAFAEEEREPVDFTDARTIANGLREDPLVLVDSQGWAQHDLSIRGSGYSGSGISINGLNLKVPYSGHFNAELPIPGYLLAAPQARSGLDNVSGHLVGTAAYDTAPQKQRIQASAGIGTEEHYTAAVLGQMENFGAFMDWEKARQIDYDANYLDRISGSAHVQVLLDEWLIDLIGGHQQTDFGAQGYYGIPSTVYAEDRFEDTLVFFGATRGALDDAYIRLSSAWRQFDDTYRIPTAGFKNDVRSRFGALAVEGRTMEIQNIALNLRGDIENEQVAGDIGSHDRTRGSVLLLPQLTFERFKFTAGLNAVFQTSESAEWLPQAGADWFVTDNSALYASYSGNVQQPDYQTLYYTDPFHIGNPLLNQQRSQNAELGFRQTVSASLDWRAAGFYRRMDDASDWVKNTAADTAWTATDLGALSVAGFESEINFYPSDELALRALYQWITKDDYDFYAGLYELDYPEHLLTFSGHWKPTREIMLFAAQALRYQTGNHARNGSDFGADASLGLHYFPRFARNMRLSFMVDNLWGTTFQAIPGLKPPERTFTCGITVAW